MRLSRNCLAQDSILITKSISRKRYTRERRNIKEIGNNYIDNNTMWIIVAVILAFVFAGALNKASRLNDNVNGNDNDDWVQLDGDLD